MYYTLVRKDPCLVITTNKQDPHTILCGDYDYIASEVLYGVTEEELVPFNVLTAMELYQKLNEILDELGKPMMQVQYVGTENALRLYMKVPMWYAHGISVPYPTYAEDPNVIKSEMVREPDEFTERIADLTDLALKNYADGVMLEKEGSRPTLSQEQPEDYKDGAILGYVLIPIRQGITPVMSFSDTRSYE